jgi:hypothetical protein
MKSKARGNEPGKHHSQGRSFAEYFCVQARAQIPSVSPRRFYLESKMEVRLMPHSNRRVLFLRMTLGVLLTGAALSLPAQQISAPVQTAALPDAPQPQVAAGTPDAHHMSPRKDCPAASPAGGKQKSAAAGCAPKFDFFNPLGQPKKTGPLTPKDKLRLAASDVMDPFNLVTIAATAAATIGSDPHTAYGPGIKGWAKNSGTLLTEDMTGRFFATFLIPSLTRQDPRYHRMPKASIPRRIAHAIVQPVWTRSDKGRPMLNYGSLIGIPATITLANVYVPDREQGVGPTAESSAITIALSPIDNFVSEFLPDVSKHFSIRIVFIQRIVNHIALTGGPT